MNSLHATHVRHQLFSGASALLVPLVALLIQLLLSGSLTMSLEVAEINALWGITGICLAIPLILERHSQLPGYHSLGHAIGVVTALFGCLLLIILLCRIDYARSVLLTGLALSMLWSQCYVLWLLRHPSAPLALVPGHGADVLRQLRQCREWPLLVQPGDEWPTQARGVATDLHQDLSADWGRAVVELSLRGIPVYDASQVHESLSGRVSTDYLTANQVGSLVPSPIYLPVKRAMDVVSSLLILLPCMILMPFVALAIRWDSPGSVIFSQQRIGLNGKPFVLYKLRTMHQAPSTDDDTTVSTDRNDHRITCVGRYLRKIRLDELPQLWNVLRGDMSMIGPRPAVATQDDLNEAHIPFYRHRHIVRPGISGWAQVRQGYVEDENADATQLKIEYDFYYIRHLSLWLDGIITLLTLWTVLSGRGAR